MIRIEHPRRFAHGQALGRLEERDGEQVDADDERIDEMLQAPVEDVELQQMHYGHDRPVEQVAVVENEEGIRWWITKRNIDSEGIPGHVQRTARLALED